MVCFVSLNHDACLLSPRCERPIRVPVSFAVMASPVNLVVDNLGTSPGTYFALNISRKDFLSYQDDPNDLQMNKGFQFWRHFEGLLVESVKSR